MTPVILFFRFVKFQRVFSVKIAKLLVAVERNRDLTLFGPQVVTQIILTFFSLFFPLFVV